MKDSDSDWGEGSGNGEEDEVIIEENSSNMDEEMYFLNGFLNVALKLKRKVDLNPTKRKNPNQRMLLFKRSTKW